MSVQTRLHLQPDGRLVIEAAQDVEPILERNHALRSMPQKSDWGRHVATIPNIILVKWMNEEGANVLKMGSDEFGAFLRKKLADPDWRHLRTDK